MHVGEPVRDCRIRDLSGRAVAVLCVLALWSSACTIGTGKDSSPDVSALRGGTLRVAIPPGFLDNLAFLDPQRPFSVFSFEPELFRCCLIRTLLSYSGRPTGEGGTALRPDIASEMPQVSRDGLTWTFQLKEGLRYAPPLDDVEITAADVVRSIQRAAASDVAASGYSTYYSVIQGFEDYAAGKTDSISGLEVIDPHTLRVDLTQVTNDLGYRFALPGSAPIPPSPSDPTAPFGAATGHDPGYGPYLVASGPYMLKGAEQLDPAMPPAEQPRAQGLGRTSVTLVRDPSWDPSSDDLRAAFVDRIELVVLDPADAALGIDQDRIDLSFGGVAPQDQVDRYLADPGLADRVHRGLVDLFVGYAAMNLAVPPFDDVHVRRAVNFAYDAERYVRISNRGTYQGGSFPFTTFGHIAPDGTEAGLLHGYDPYPFDLDSARREMALSSYDRNGDGVCDDPSCHGVFALDTAGGPEAQTERVWINGLRKVGITLAIRRVPNHPGASRYLKISADPSRKVALNLGTYWIGDYPNASSFFTHLFGVDGIGATPFGNVSLVGAAPSQLEGWGYHVTSVPKVDQKIGECLSIIGFAQERCWAELDQTLMTKIVPWVPQVVLQYQTVVSEHVVRYSVDQAFGWDALDQIALADAST